MENFILFVLVCIFLMFLGPLIGYASWLIIACGESLFIVVGEVFDVFVYAWSGTVSSGDRYYITVLNECREFLMNTGASKFGGEYGAWLLLNLRVLGIWVLFFITFYLADLFFNKCMDKWGCDTTGEKIILYINDFIKFITCRIENFICGFIVAIGSAAALGFSLRILGWIVNML